MSITSNHAKVRVSLEQVTQRFRLVRERTDTLKEAFANLLKRRSTHEDFTAIDSLTMVVNQGEMLGLIGRNGSGKSTLLKMIGGIYRPTSGRVWVDGTLAPLIELGAGFNPELTGRENVFLNGAILGFTKSEMRSKFDRIVEFAELWNFIDAPLKSYSSGMTMRLAFATGTDADPDILLIDEILAVGDADFQGKCLKRLHEFRERGKTILFVSHNLEIVKELCHRVIVLNCGRVVAAGKPEEAIEAYQELITRKHTLSSVSTSSVSSAKDKEVEIQDVQFLDEHSNPAAIFRNGQVLVVRVFFSARKPVTNPALRLGFHREGGLLIANPSTEFDKQFGLHLEEEGFVDYIIEHLPLLPGTYEVSPAILGNRADDILDFQERKYRFAVTNGGPDARYGFITFDGKWRLGANRPESDTKP